MDAHVLAREFVATTCDSSMTLKHAHASVSQSIARLAFSKILIYAHADATQRFHAQTVLYGTIINVAACDPQSFKSLSVHVLIKNDINHLCL